MTDTTVRVTISDHSYSDLAEALEAYGQQTAQHYQDRFGMDPSEQSYFEVDVRGWAQGPRLYITSYRADGTPKVAPTIGRGTTQVVINAGYAPWGFRPNTHEGEFTRQGQFMWYLRPIDDEPLSVDYQYGIEVDGRLLVQQSGDDEGNFITFNDREKAESLASELGRDAEVVEVMA